MIWLYIALFLASLFMGFFDVPSWMFFLLLIPFLGVAFYLTLFPVLFEKDVNKIWNFLKKSKHAHYQFTYHFFNNDLEEAEKAIQRIKSKQLITINQIILLTKQNKFTEAKAIHPQLKDNVYKWYYGAVIAMEEEDYDTYEQYKARLKDPLYLAFLEMEEKVRAGRKAEALAVLEEKMSKVSGLKLFSTAQYKKEIEQK